MPISMSVSARYGTSHSSRRYLFPVLSVLLLAGCVTFTADPKNMAVSMPQAGLGFPPAIRNAMCVRSVSGGEPASFGAPIARVGDEQFHEALMQTLRDNRLLAADGDCRYQIDVDILGMSDIRMPDGLVSHRAVANINYKVYQGNSPILLETIQAPFTAYAFAGNTRITEAHEGAIRESLIEFLRRLSKARI